MKIKLGQNNPIDWNDLAIALEETFGECPLDEGDENNPLDWWLTDVTVGEIIDFLKEYHKLDTDENATD